MFLSINFMTSLATKNDPTFGCFAKKITSLLLASCTRTLSYELLFTIEFKNDPIIRCKSKDDKCGASPLTMNFKNVKASMHTSASSSFKSMLLNVVKGSIKVLAD